MVSTGRKVLAGVLVIVAIVVQVTVVTRLPFPGGVTPDLVLLVVVALALVHGPLGGAVTGFCAGLAADLAPPAVHPIGQYALVLCALGYLCGLARGESERSSVLPFIVAGAGALVGTLLYALVGALFGDARITWATVRSVLWLSVLYDVMVSPFVLFTVVRLDQWVNPEPDDAATSITQRQRFRKYRNMPW